MKPTRYDSHQVIEDMSKELKLQINASSILSSLVVVIFHIRPERSDT